MNEEGVMNYFIKYFILILILPNLLFSTNKIEQCQKELKENILIWDINNNEKSKEIIKNAYLQLIKIGTPEAFYQIEKSYGYLCNEYPEVTENLAKIFYSVVNDNPEYKKSVIGYFLELLKENNCSNILFDVSILLGLDKFVIYDSFNIDQIDLKRNPFFVWTRDRRILPILDKYTPTNTEDSLNAAFYYCYLDVDYKRNIGFVNSFVTSENLRNKYKTNTPFYDDIISSYRSLLDPDGIEILKLILRYNLNIDFFHDDVESLIEKLESQRNIIHYSKTKIQVSSELKDISNEYRYSYWNLEDNFLNSAWVEGVKGDGIGEWLSFEFDTSYTVTGLKIVNGYAKDKFTFQNNNRVQDFEIQYQDGSSVYGIFLDTNEWQKIDLSPKKTNKIRLVIKSVYKGIKYSDTCISEIRILIN